MSRGYPVTKQMKIERRVRAEARQAEYEKLSVEEKLSRLPKDGSKKQRAKLQALLEKQQSKNS